MTDKDEILTAITELVAEIRTNHSELHDRIDALAEIIDRNFGRVEGDAARIENGVNAIRADLTSLRSEIRSEVKRQDERITAIDKRRA